MNVEHIFEGINPTTRKTAYYVYGLIGVAIGAIQVGYSAAELGQPTWLTVALAVFSFIGAAFGITSGQNTLKQLIEVEHEATDVDLDFDAVDAELDELNGGIEEYSPGAHAAEVDYSPIDRTAAYFVWCGSLHWPRHHCDGGAYFFVPSYLKNGYNQTHISGTPEHAQHA